MSQGHPDDLKKTLEELMQSTGLNNGRNWLGHVGKQAQRIDELLLIGASKQEIVRDLIEKGLSKINIHNTILTNMRLISGGHWVLGRCSINSITQDEAFGIIISYDDLGGTEILWPACIPRKSIQWKNSVLGSRRQRKISCFIPIGRR